MLNEDDPVRALRAVRLSAQFDLKIHPEAAAVIRARSAELTQVSGERARRAVQVARPGAGGRALRVLLHMNLLQTLMAPQPAVETEDAIAGTDPEAWHESLAATERMSALLTAISSRRSDNTAAAFDLGMLVIQLDRFRAVLQAHIAGEYGLSRSHGELLTLAALLHNRAPAEVESLLASLKLSLAEERILLRAVANYRRVSDQRSWPSLDQHRFWYELGAGGIDAILLASAQYLGARRAGFKQHDWLGFVDAATTLLDAYFNRHAQIVDPALLLNGNDIRRLCQLAPGPLVGELLTALREAQVTGAVQSSDEATEFVVKQAANRKQQSG